MPARDRSSRRDWLTHLTQFRVSIVTGLVTIVLFSTLSGLPLLRQLEGLLLDLRFQMRGPIDDGGRVAIIHVDDRSLEAYGRWPWPRSRIADVVERLTGAGAKVIALDILLTEAENSFSGREAEAAREVLNMLGEGRTAEAVARFHDTMPDWQSGIGSDHKLAAALKDAGSAVVPFALIFAGDGADAARTAEVPRAVRAAAYRVKLTDDGAAPRIALHASGVLAPIPEHADAAAALGFVSLYLDVDGTARYEYPVLPVGADHYPSFPIQIARLMLGLTPDETAVDFRPGAQGIRLGERVVPTDESMRMLANFYGPPGTIATHSYVDVMEGRVPAAAFAGKAVLIGVHGEGIRDAFVTPFSPVLPGVERVGTIVDNILTGRFVERRDDFWLYEIATIVAGCLLLGLAGGRLSSIAFSFVALLAGAATVLASYAAFRFAGLWLNLAFPLFGLLLTYSSITIVTYLRQEQRERTTRRAFDHYLHPALVEALCQNPDVLKLGGERKMLSVLFSDVRNFSTLSEGLEPEVLVRLMNEYFDAITEAVLNNQGLLDKYIGDELMAVFGAPVPIPAEEQALAACKAALDMVQIAQRLSVEWQQRGFAPLAIGVGINTGEMIIGNMGSRAHFDYTVMGDEVNIASRLEQLNKEFGTNVIISGQTRDLVAGRIATRELDRVVVKGRTQPVGIYEVLGHEPVTGELRSIKVTFEGALGAFRGRRFEEAITGFEHVLRLKPDDKASRLFIDRCHLMIRNPPPADWNGVIPDRRMARTPAGAAA